MGKGLLLLPNTLDPSLDPKVYLPSILVEVLPKISGIIAESEKGARHFLKCFLPETFRNIPIRLLNEHSSKADIKELLGFLKRGETWGLISDCGLPILADPGSELVKEAHIHHIPVQAYPGPSSIFLALMLSGFSGQTFTFHGYLPREPEPLKKKISEMERQNHTHLFIEAPYRNRKLFEALLNHLAPETSLCLAWNLLLPDQTVLMKKVKDWKKSEQPEINKKPAVFLFRNH